MDYRRIICGLAMVSFAFIETMAQQGNVDTHIAVNTQVDNNTFALIISNENYQFEEPVPFACNDGATVKRYLEKTLGVPEKNIKFVQNATLNVMKFNLAWLERIMGVKNGEARCFFYYSGHGMPDEASKKAYLLPVDGFSTEPSTGFGTDELYRRLGAIPSKATMVLLDACFSGAKRDGTMLASSRGVAIKAKAEMISTYFKEPTFDSLSTFGDNISYADVAKEPDLYLGCSVAWSGRISNSVSEGKSFRCDLLVGYENMERVEGFVPLIFAESPQPPIDGERPIKVLGKIKVENGKIALEGKAVYQPVNREN